MTKEKRTFRATLFKLAVSVGLIVNCALKAPAEETFSPEQAETNAKLAKYGINWRNNLAEAQRAAHQERKPILWIHVLGNMDGFT